MHVRIQNKFLICVQSLEGLLYFSFYPSSDKEILGVVRASSFPTRFVDINHTKQNGATWDSEIFGKSLKSNFLFKEDTTPVIFFTESRNFFWLRMFQWTDMVWSKAQLTVKDNWELVVPESYVMTYLWLDIYILEHRDMKIIWNTSNNIEKVVVSLRALKVVKIIMKLTSFCLNTIYVQYFYQIFRYSI